MANNRNSTQTSSQKQVVTFQYQLLDDLYFSCVSQKEMDKIHDASAQGSKGCCGSYVTVDESLIFFIFVIRDLDLDIFLKVFCDEFYHYCTDRIIFKWLDPQLTGEIPPLTNFISEMLSHEACWDCKHLGSITCWKHPKNPVKITLDAPARITSLDDESFLTFAIECLDAIEQILEDCLFLKMYDYDDFRNSLYIELNRSRAIITGDYTQTISENSLS